MKIIERAYRFFVSILRDTRNFQSSTGDIETVRKARCFAKRQTRRVVDQLLSGREGEPREAE